MSYCSGFETLSRCLTCPRLPFCMVDMIIRDEARRQRLRFEAWSNRAQKVMGSRLPELTVIKTGGKLRYVITKAKGVI